MRPAQIATRALRGHVRLVAVAGAAGTAIFLPPMTLGLITGIDMLRLFADTPFGLVFGMLWLGSACGGLAGFVGFVVFAGTPRHMFVRHPGVRKATRRALLCGCASAFTLAMGNWIVHELGYGWLLFALGVGGAVLARDLSRMSRS